MVNQILKVILLSLSTQLAYAQLSVMTINAEWLWTPFDNHIDGTKFNKGDMSPKNYLEEIIFYSNVIKDNGVQILAISEIENSLVAAHLAGKLGGKWRAYFKQGRDTATGQDVAILSNLELVKGSVTDFGFPSGSLSGSKKSKRLSKVLGAQFWVVSSGIKNKVGVITAHFLSKRNESTSKNKKRQRQAVALNKAVKRYRKDTDKLIVLGDFNDYLDSESLKILLDHGSLRSIRLIGKQKRPRIDHILYQGLLENRSRVIDLKKYSDHDAVMTEFY